MHCSAEFRDLRVALSALTSRLSVVCLCGTVRSGDYGRGMMGGDAGDADGGTWCPGPYKINIVIKIYRKRESRVYE
jgi:hypothetical protein